MANIRNSISLQDRMTPVFRSVIKSMDSTLRVMRNLDRQANNGIQSKAYRRAQRDIQRANNELVRMQNNLNMADRGANKLVNSTNKVATNMSRMGSGGLNLTNLASGLYLLKNIGTALSNIMSTPDTMSAIKYRLETFDTTDATGSQLMDMAYKTAQGSRSDIESTASLASRILLSGATDGSAAEAMNLSGILNKASFLGGSSAQESQRALLQLSQGLASGVLQGDELRSIREQAPGLTDTLAKGLSSLAEKGLLPEKFLNTTMGDLKALGSEGELTSDRIVAAFKEMEGYVDETFEKSPKQFGQAMTGILNVWKRWLGLMGQGDNAFAKINEKAWDLLEWLESPAGDKFFTGLANGINFAVDLLFEVIDAISAVIRWFSDLENSSEILQSAFITLGIVAVGSGVAAAIAWAIANWQMLLIVAAIGLVVYALMELGLSAGQIIGGIGAGIMWILAVVAWVVMGAWDLILMFIMFIIDLIIGVVTVVTWVCQGIIQIILWLITTIWGILVTLYDIGYTVWHGFLGIAKGAIVGVYSAFAWMADGVLGLLQKIAEGIDWVFGSNLAATVGGWRTGLDKSVDDLNAYLDPKGEFEKIENQWKTSYSDLGDMYAGKGKYDDWNIIDNMKGTYDGAYNIVDSVNTGLMGATFYGEDGQSYKDVFNWAKNGSQDSINFGKGLDESIGTFSMKLEEFGDDWNSGLSLDGGSLDSVGSIGSDVEISDEDIQLLRDVAARDFLVALQTSTPQVNNTFGDIKETADVNKILEIIQDMVDEQLAVSLVVE